MADLEIALKYTLPDEGGWSDNPNDPGGATMHGITLATYSAYLNRMVSKDELKKIAIEDVQQIYMINFWLPMKLQALDSQTIATAIFNIGINRGPHRTVTLAQGVLGYDVAKMDGIMGPDTIRDLNALHNDTYFINSFVVRVKAMYEIIATHNSHEKEFLDGWLNRASRLLTLLEVTP